MKVSGREKKCRLPFGMVFASTVDHVLKLFCNTNHAWCYVYSCCIVWCY